jgi:hypothetical protein
MKKKVAVFSMILIFVGMITAANAVTIALVDRYQPNTVFNTFTYWCNNPVVENFEDAILVPGLSITEVGGAGSIALGVYTNIVDVDIPRYQVFNYPSMRGFGGWFELDNPGSEIDIYINDIQPGNFIRKIPEFLNDRSSFYGFYVIDGPPFSKVILVDHAIQTGEQSYAIADLAICPVPPVPIPGSLLLLGSCIFGLLGLRRVRKN